MGLLFYVDDDPGPATKRWAILAVTHGGTNEAFFGRC